MIHDYTNYGRGCRCATCRAAKAEYTRRARAAAREARITAEAEGRTHVVEGITHGIGGYQNYSCRCFTCRLANANSSARVRQRRAAEKGAA